jgi:hypothetical protein
MLEADGGRLRVFSGDAVLSIGSAAYCPPELLPEQRRHPRRFRRRPLSIRVVNDYHPRHEDPSETGQRSPF